MSATRSSKLGRSSRATRQVRDPQATRAAILEAAAEEFAEHGLASARTEDIAERTGLSKAIIYYYFESKEELYQAVLEQLFTDRLRQNEQMNFQDLPPAEALETYVRQVLTQTSANPKLPAILLLEAIQNKGKYYSQAVRGVPYSELITILERGMTEGVFRPLDAQHTAVNIMGTCIFYFGAHENIKPLWPGKRMLSKPMLEQHAQQALDFILAGVRPQGANSRWA